MAIEHIIAFMRSEDYLFAKVVFILLLTFLLERITRFSIGRIMTKHSKNLKVDDRTTFAVLKHFISGMIYMLGIGLAIYSVPTLQKLSISIFASAGVIAIIIGFAAQKAFSDLISGIFIAIFKPFRIGDIIKFQQNLGEVEDITMRHTVIKNFENRRFIVPNSKISEEVIENFNINDAKTCRFVEFRISLDSDMGKAMEIMRDEGMKHPFCIDNRSDKDKEEGAPQIIVRVLGFGESSINLRAWAWAETPRNAFIMGCDLNKSIKERFDHEGVEVPYPYRTIVNKEKMKNRIE